MLPATVMDEEEEVVKEEQKTRHNILREMNRAWFKIKVLGVGQ